MNQQPIGIYDSGVGGLTVLQALRHHFPRENFVYIADTVNLPYGHRPPEEILHISKNIVLYLHRHHRVKLVVAACNTSSALALDWVSQKVSIPTIGTIKPLRRLKDANHQLEAGIVILATPNSAASRYHENFLRQHGITAPIYTVGCPDFVPLIEAGDLDAPSLRAAALRYLSPVLSLGFGSILFGCTHYPFLKPLLETIVPPTTLYLNPADFMVADVQDYVSHIEQNTPTTSVASSPQGSCRFFASAAPEVFGEKLRQLMGESFGTPSVTLCAPHDTRANHVP